MTTEELDKIMDEAREEAIAWANRHGGSTGSNMAEPLWYSSDPVHGLSPEEAARRKKETEDLDEFIARAHSHIRN